MNDDHVNCHAVSAAISGLGLILNGVVNYFQLRDNRSERHMVDRGPIELAILSDDRRLFKLTRLTGAAFNVLHEILKPFMPQNENEHFRTGRPPHSSQIVLLTGLCHLAGGQRLIATGEGLKMGTSTVFKHLKTVVKAILMAKDTSDLLKVSMETDIAHRVSVFDGVFTRFGAKRSPQVAGAIDVTHVPIIAPRSSTSDAYYTITKRCYSISVQAVADWNLNFSSVMAGYPGGMNDARIFEESKILDMVPEGLRLLGDGAYPSSNKLISPFRITGMLTQEQKDYNNLVSQARNCVERAFANLKKRWRILVQNEVRDLPFLNQTIVACACLNNFCQRQGLPVLDLEETNTEEVSNEQEFVDDDNDAGGNGSTYWRHYYASLLLQ